VQPEVDVRHIAGPTLRDMWDVALRYRATFVGERLNFSPTDFARTLAKIAYGILVCSLGIRPFKNAEIRRVILGQDPYVARNERSCHQRQSSWNSFVLNDF
jgi:hypothetical protein